MSIKQDYLYKLIHGDVDIYENFDYTKYEDILYGWNSDHHFFHEIINDSKPSYILEIGSFLGKSAINMGNYIKDNSLNTKIICVDTWLGSLEMIGHRFPAEKEKLVKNGMPRLYDYFLANIKKNGLEEIVIPFPQTSYNALNFFMQNNVLFDLIYIDGSNHYDEFKRDIDNSWDVLSNNGFIFGDDYRNFHWPHIQIAINEFVADNKLIDDFKVSYNCYWSLKKKTGDIKYIITSHPKYTKALEHMLDSMYMAKVKPADIVVIMGDCDTSGKYINESIKMRPGVNYVFIENNLYEYNFFIGVMKAIDLGICKRIDNFVLLHDTCLAGGHFLKSVASHKNFSEQIVWHNKRGNYNIGMFKYAAIKEGFNLFKSMKTLDKHTAILMEHNKHHLSVKRFNVSQRCPIQIGKQTIHNFSYFDVYNEGRMRTVAYLRTYDLLKFFLWVPNGSEHPNRIEDDE